MKKLYRGVILVPQEVFIEADDTEDAGRQLQLLAEVKVGPIHPDPVLNARMYTTIVGVSLANKQDREGYNATYQTNF